MNSSRFDFDYIIIGSGPAGSTAALELAKHKKKVCLIEHKFLGGSDLNARDIPYTMALDFAHDYGRAMDCPELRSAELGFSLPTLAAQTLKMITALGAEEKKILEDAGVKLVKGYANILDNHTIAVGSKKITGMGLILATGAKLRTLEVAGTDTVKYATPESAIRIRRLPKAVAIVGGGSTGCEVASFYAELGAKVVILETAERLLPKEDEEVGEVLTHYLTKRLGAMVLTSAKVVAIEQDKLSRKVIFRYNNAEKMVRVESIVLATGSQPVLDYGLENAGVKYKNSGITVDKYFQTSARGVYAIGDCLGGESSTERASQQGLTLALNLVSRSKTPMNDKGFVRMTKSRPGVATVGLNEDDLLRRDRNYRKALVKLSDIKAGAVKQFEDGFVKLIADKNGKLIGATIVAPEAGLMAAELAVAIRHNLTALEIASTPHLMNDYNYMVKLAARKLALDKK